MWVSTYQHHSLVAETDFLFSPEGILSTWKGVFQAIPVDAIELKKAIFDVVSRLALLPFVPSGLNRWMVLQKFVHEISDWASPVHIHPSTQQTPSPPTFSNQS